MKPLDGLERVDSHRSVGFISESQAVDIGYPASQGRFDSVKRCAGVW